MLDALARTNPPVSREDNEPAHVADPLADLLLSAAAIVVIAVIAVLPIMPRHSTLPREPSRALQNNMVFRYLATGKSSRSSLPNGALSSVVHRSAHDPGRQNLL
jgi:hypothetical protein